MPVTVNVKLFWEWLWHEIWEAAANVLKTCTEKMKNENSCYEEKQPLEVFCEKRCSSKFHKTHRKTPLLESLFSCEFCKNFKGTPMQTWKSPYMSVFIYKYYPEHFAFLILEILKLYTRKSTKCLFTNMQKQ